MSSAEAPALCLQLRVGLIQLSYLTVRSPTQIAVTGFAQVCLGDSLEGTSREESRGELASDAFVVDETVLHASRIDSS